MKILKIEDQNFYRLHRHTKFTIPSHIVTAFYGIDQEAPYAVVRLYIALRYEGDGEAELGHGSERQRVAQSN